LLLQLLNATIPDAIHFYCFPPLPAILPQMYSTTRTKGISLAI
jgi:hypothetical protein